MLILPFRSLPILLAAVSSFQLAKATIFCVNNPSHSFTFNNRSRDCDWLLSVDQGTRSNICSTDPATEQACPFSCSVCCKDNPFYRLFNNQRVYSCGDIEKNANLQELYCDLSLGPNGAKVKETCPEACGYCPVPLTVNSFLTHHPSGRPSSTPTILSSSQLSISPTITPSNVPTNALSSLPTVTSSHVPTNNPSGLPTNAPSGLPTNAPSGLPTVTPSNVPTNAPSGLPTHHTSEKPSTSPSRKLPAHVTVHPTVHPASSPSSQPNPATKLNKEFDDDEKLNGDSSFSKTYNSQIDAKKKNKRNMKMIYIIIGSICSCFVILGLAIFRRRRCSYYDDAESDTHASKIDFFDMVINTFGYVHQGSSSSSDSDGFSLGNSFDSSETEKYVKKVRG